MSQQRCIFGFGLLLCCWVVSLAQPVPLTPEGWMIPQVGNPFQFPKDHGSHPRFGIEWWYITGHLQDTNRTRYGFQATFFRRGIPPSKTHSAATAVFGDQQLFLAHMALLEVDTGRFRHQERLNREGWDAFAAQETLDVRNGNWSLCWTSSPSSQPELQLKGSIRAEILMDFHLRPMKPLVQFGTNGVSRKAEEPTASSHYLTFPRLAVSGTLTVEGSPRWVSGEAWMDHEWSSSQLGRGQVGWDWACLQLKDGREIMAYRMRREDGTSDPFSTLAWVSQQGKVRHIGASGFTWKPIGEWVSPQTGARYPARVQITTDDPESGRRQVFLVEPWVANQELVGALGGIAYWEGACRVLDSEGKEVGQAFLEMTGYAESMQGKL